MSKAPFILMVNPWITDFAAYDYWAKPLGLLRLASLLRAGGCGVALIDCLDRYDALTNGHPDVIPGVGRRYGTGKYPKMRLPKPEAYAGIPRLYYRHGIHPGSFRRKLEAVDKPDLVWVTSIMTYWYPGVQQTIDVIREVFPHTPVWLGGIYAQLCPQHALRMSGASEIVTLPAERLPEKITAATGFVLKNRQEWMFFELSPAPALDLLSKLTYAPVMTGQGCTFRCPYCASEILQPRFQRRGADAIYEEISHWHLRYGVLDFAFYDDALLIQAQSSLEPALRRICRSRPGLRFHTPNAIHICSLTPECCRLLRESGFTTLRLGLETTQSQRQQNWGGKVKTGMFLKAVENLFGAGFSPRQIGVYLLCGVPGQSPEEVAEAIHVVKETGVLPHIAEYSPIPGTQMWLSARKLSPFDLAGEPLYHNNTFFACRRPDFSYEDLLQLKDLARQARPNGPGGSGLWENSP
jgi:radical SAM superfamily enzyme YgiQ (UPF0313 family)